jgi:hypothetical protein
MIKGQVCRGFKRKSGIKDALEGALSLGGSPRASILFLNVGPAAGNICLAYPRSDGPGRTHMLDFQIGFSWRWASRARKAQPFSKHKAS